MGSPDHHAVGAAQFVYERRLLRSTASEKSNFVSVRYEKAAYSADAQGTAGRSVAVGEAFEGMRSPRA